MKSLTPQQVEYYRYNGFLFPVPALTATEIATCLAGVERLESHLGSPIAAADVKWRSHAHAHSPWFNDLIRHPRILDAVEDLIGPDILVWTSTFFIKEPRSPTFAAWHQDATYFGLQPKESVCATRRRKRAAWSPCRAAALPASFTMTRSGWNTASTAPARPSRSRSTKPVRSRCRFPPDRSRCITSSRFTAPRPITPLTGGLVLG